jgi:hypothetical protein
MRELKFKIWYPKDKSMRGPYTIEDVANQYFANIEERERIVEYENEDRDGYPCGAKIKEGLVFLQYTGFNDCKGDEIYEGDYISGFRGTLAKGEVCFNKFRGSWLVYFGEGYALPDLAALINESGHRYTITSNIYGNPKEDGDEEN